MGAADPTPFPRAAREAVPREGPKKGCHHGTTRKSGASSRSLAPARNQETGLMESRIASGATGGSIESRLVSDWVRPGKRSPGEGRGKGGIEGAGRLAKACERSAV